MLSNINKILIFLFPIFLALPDLAINLSVINLRFDDLIIYILFLLNINKLINFTKIVRPKLFYNIQYIMFLYAFLYFLVLYIIQKDNYISYYEITRSLGSLPYLLVLPYILNNKEYRESFYNGALIGGAIYIYSLIKNYETILHEGFIAKTSASLKKHIAFSTLNPNAVATLASILGWINILGFIEKRKKINIIIAIILLLIPIMVFARAMSIGMIVSVFIFIILQRKKSIKTIFSYILIGVIVIFIILNFIDTSLLENATNVDLSTGEGFSGRYTLWKQGVEIILNSPILAIVGHGFGVEHGLYVKFFEGHQSHQIFLHYAIELGIIVMFVFIFSILYLIINRYMLYNKTFKLVYLIQVCIISSFFIADFTGQLLYFNKYAYLIFCLASFNLFKKG